MKKIVRLVVSSLHLVLVLVGGKIAVTSRLMCSSVFPKGLVIELSFACCLCHLCGKGKSVQFAFIVWWLVLQRRCHLTPIHQRLAGRGGEKVSLKRENTGYNNTAVSPTTGGGVAENAF